MLLPTPSPTAKSGTGLALLEALLLKDLERLAYPKRSWVLPRRSQEGQAVLDVVIIGGGQSGLAAAFGLLREKVTNLLVVDENAPGLAGPWKTFARMHTLRTPKHLTGPDHNLPNLCFQSWYEAQHGEAAWQQLGLIPKELWADYLDWYRRFLGIPVRCHARVGALSWRASDACFAVPLQPQDGGAPEVLLARKVVIATGIDGSGRWESPAMVSRLPRALWAHTRDAIDFEALRGKRVGLLGAGASAFDNGSVALEKGAAEVHLFYRRKTLPTVNAYRWAEFVGFLKHHGDLPDGDRWRFIRRILEMGQLPPHDTYHRARAHPNFHLHAQSPWLDVQAVNGEAHVTTPHGTFAFDKLIVGSGTVTDLTLRPELANVVADIALWKDRYTPPPQEAHEDLARHPYLGPNFEFQEKVPGRAPYLSSLFNYTFGGLPSLGFGGASISGLKYSLPRLVSGITRQLYLEDKDAFFESLMTYDVKEFEP
ncbi:Predicted flavoprotein CzcO associated with the cation diffusion facilitator CzcD [Stigmatella aurantiaca]|uniref:Predicted flavoprotein CzcO associated with the cation diffusion facilitator CzcD n=1 Tax=Stigmatella aurantiaca TaxID=41 RepID=A0A1H7PEM1_STIAU|nr:NAD(P)/FAD-dependent oxidoreductase [Stigmatella aurantiaca]SEL34221.1 Predicted flavoprotein CzcO associated with the cation diffusion facilitator CzcD [Stigmatella aurantiaca]